MQLRLMNVCRTISGFTCCNLVSFCSICLLPEQQELFVFGSVGENAFITPLLPVFNNRILNRMPFANNGKTEDSILKSIMVLSLSPVNCKQFDTAGKLERHKREQKITNTQKLTLRPYNILVLISIMVSLQRLLQRAGLYYYLVPAVPPY